MGGSVGGFLGDVVNVATLGAVDLGGSSGGSFNPMSGVTQRPLTKQELDLLTAQKYSLDSAVDIAKQQNARSLESQDLWKQNYLPYEQQLGRLTTQGNSQLGGLASGFANSSQNLANKYSTGLADLASRAGTADSDYLANAKAQAYGGLSTASDTAQRSLQESLARRGVTGGAYNQALVNSSIAKQNAMAQAGTQAYSSAIAQSDARRSALANAMGQGYGAQSQALGAGLNAQSSGIQQQLGNLQNYANLGRGMAGMSQNYLGQAGQTYTNVGNAFGQSANAIGNNQASFMGAQMQANAQAQAGKGAMTGSLIGAGSALGVAAMASDERLKDNIIHIGTINGFPLYKWEWNEKAIELGVDNMPSFGVIAQEMLELYPEAVELYPDGYYRVNYSMVLEA